MKKLVKVLLPLVAFAAAPLYSAVYAYKTLADGSRVVDSIIVQGEDCAKLCIDAGGKPRAVSADQYAAVVSCKCEGVTKKLPPLPSLPAGATLYNYDFISNGTPVNLQTLKDKCARVCVDNGKKSVSGSEIGLTAEDIQEAAVVSLRVPCYCK